MKSILLTALCICYLNLSAQGITSDDNPPQLNISRATGFTIDGKIDEAAWENIEVATNFQINAPVDNKTATYQTKVKMAYDDRYLYLSAICYDDENLVIQTLKRDVFDGSDVFSLILDPIGEQTNGFAFAVNALGAPTESLVGINGNSDDNWDNKWQVATQQYTDKWTVEMAIPFKTLRYKAGQKEWGIQFARVDPGLNETHVWAPVPRQFLFFDLAYFGKLIFDEAPEKAGGNISLIPYTTINLQQNRVNGAKKGSHNFQSGGDAKMALTSSLNLDLTFNPDFSQVEVDQQVTNLGRFSIFFPERRQFFIENSDIFSRFGQWADAPFYSRRIGLDASGQRVPIKYGARLTGNLASKTRIGLFSMQTEETAGQLAQNYSAAVVQQRFGQRSSIKGIFLNRQAFSDGKTQDGDYGRNLGGEIRLSTPDGKWRSHGGYLQSFKQGITSDNSHIYGGVNYDGQRFRTFVYAQHLSSNYYADMGFNSRLLNYNPETNELVRLGYTNISNMINYYTYPKDSKKVNFHWSGIENYVFINDETGLNEYYLRLRHFIFFKNTSQLRFRLNNNYVDLVFPFALTESPLPAKSYNMTEFNVQFNTDQRKQFNTEWFVVYGQFYDGTKLTYRGSVNFRTQPWGNFTLGIEQNNIQLGDEHGELKLTSANIRAEINFSTRLFWTTFLQYNTQAENFNINTRLQWRYAPMSDLFLVYTDNYRAENLFGSMSMFGSKNRSLVLKVNYWLSI